MGFFPRPLIANRRKTFICFETPHTVRWECYSGARPFGFNSVKMPRAENLYILKITLRMSREGQLPFTLQHRT